MTDRWKRTIGLAGFAEADGRVEVGDRLAVFSRGGPGLAAQGVGRCVLGIEANGLAKVGDRLVVVFLDEPDESAVVIGESVVGVEPDRLTKVGDCLVAVSLGAPSGDAAVAGRPPAASPGSRRMASP